MLALNAAGLSEPGEVAEVLELKENISMSSENALYFEL